MRSKLGPFILQSYRGQLEALIAARPPIVKAFDFGQLIELHNHLGEATIFIARLNTGGDDFKRFENGLAVTNPRAAAAKWWEYARHELRSVDLRFAYIEGHNEMADWDVLPQFGEFEAERQRLMAEDGYRACIANFSVGCPDLSEFAGDPDRPDVWYTMYPALEAAHRYHNLLGLHEYGGLWMWLWYGPNQHQTVADRRWVEFPGEYAEGWLFGRYRKLWRRHIAPHGWTGIRIALTELGLDRAGLVTTDLLTGGASVGPWKHCPPWWSVLNGRGDSDRYYLQQLRWADSQMQRDPYLIGATMFAWGTTDPVWSAWDIQGAVGEALLAGLRNTPYPAGTRVVIALPGLYLRTRPGGAALAVLPHGERVQTNENAGEWTRIKTDAGLTGYAMTKWLALV
jgi:hypothetical protein